MPKKEYPSVAIIINHPTVIQIDKKDDRFCGEGCPERCGGGAGFHYGLDKCYSYQLCSLSERTQQCYSFEENDYRPLRTLHCYGSEVLGDYPTPRPRAETKKNKK